MSLKEYKNLQKYSFCKNHITEKAAVPAKGGKFIQGITDTRVGRIIGCL